MNLQARVDEIRNRLPDGYDIQLVSIKPEIVLTFMVPRMPEIEGASRYLAINYITGPRLPGIAKFDTAEEAFDFLDKFEKADADYEKVLEFAKAIHEQGWQDAIYVYVGEWVDKLPAEGDGKPYWVEMSGFEGAELVTTVDASTLYGSYGDIAQPQDKNAILVKILADDIGGESEIEMAHLLEALEIEEDSLEEYLALQLVCHDERDAFVRRDLIGAIWLLAVPENLQFLEAAMESEDFQGYYDQVLYSYKHGTINERKEAIERWLMAVEKEIEDWTNEDLEEFELMLAEYRNGLEENYV